MNPREIEIKLSEVADTVLSRRVELNIDNMNEEDEIIKLTEVLISLQKSIEVVQEYGEKFKTA
jgi:hypothetical protein